MAERRLPGTYCHEGVVCVAAQRAALINGVLNDEWQDEHGVDVADVQLLDAHRNVLPLGCSPASTPGVQVGLHLGLHHLSGMWNRAEHGMLGSGAQDPEQSSQLPPFLVQHGHRCAAAQATALSTSQACLRLQGWKRKVHDSHNISHHWLRSASEPGGLLHAKLGPPHLLA